MIDPELADVLSAIITGPAAATGPYRSRRQPVRLVGLQFEHHYPPQGVCVALNPKLDMKSANC